MCVGSSTDIEPLWAIELPVVTVGLKQGDHDELVRRNGHLADPSINRGEPGRGDIDRTLIAQKLFYRGGRIRGIGAQPGER